MLYRNIETHLRIVLEERGTVVPEGDQLELLAHLLGFSDGQTLHRNLLSAMKSTRQTLLDVAEQLQ
jgi:hypothetical protein